MQEGLAAAARRRLPAPPRCRGFTLTELLATVSIAAIIAAFALPQLQVFVQNNARATRINTLVSAMTFARSQAVSLGRTMTLCPSLEIGTVSVPACNAGDNQYQTGFVVLDESDPGGRSLKKAFQPSGRGGYTLLGVTPNSAALDRVEFAATGRVTSGGANARFIYCDARGRESVRAIVLSATGGPRITSDTDNSGFDDINGTDLTCSPTPTP